MEIIQKAKELAELVRKVNDVPLYEKIVDLQGAIVTLSGEKIQLHEEVIRLRSKVRDLEEALTFKEELVVGKDSYWTKSRDGPFCLGCWDQHRHLSRLKTNPTNFLQKDCPVCMAVYYRVGPPA